MLVGRYYTLYTISDSVSSPLHVMSFSLYLRFHRKCGVYISGKYKVLSPGTWCVDHHLFRGGVSLCPDRWAFRTKNEWTSEYPLYFHRALASIPIGLTNNILSCCLCWLILATPVDVMKFSICAFTGSRRISSRSLSNRRN